MSRSHYLNVLSQAIRSGNYYTIRNLESSWGEDLLDDVWGQLSPRLKARYQSIMSRDLDTERALKNIRGEFREQALQNERSLRELNERHRRDLNNQANQFHDRLNEVHRTLQGELRNQQNQIIDLRHIQQAQRDEYTRMHKQSVRLIEEERKQREQSVKNLQAQINQINVTEQQRSALAREALEAVRILSSEIAKMPHEKFAPGKLDKINREIESVGSGTELMSQAAWHQCIQSWQDLWDLRAEIQLKENEFMAKYEQALKMAVTLLAEAKRNQERTLEFNSAGEKGKQEKSIDIDFWSQGEWSAHVNKLGEYQKRLEDSFSAQDFGIEEVEKILAELSDEGSRLGQIIINAGNNVAASELRFDLAEIGANVLYEQLFKEDSIQATYEGEDQRAGYVLQMENENGVRATMVVSDADESGEPGALKLTINFENDDSGLSQQEAAQRSDEIESMILSQAGIDLGAQKKGQSVCSHEVDSSFSDINEVKKRKASELKTIKHSQSG